MKKSTVALRLRKSRNMFVLIAVAPIAAMILMSGDAAWNR